MSGPIINSQFATVTESASTIDVGWDVTAGNALVLFAAVNPGGSEDTLSVSDNQGNDWQGPICWPNSGAPDTQAFYVLNCVGGPATLTVAGSTSPAGFGCMLCECSGVTGFDSSALQTGDAEQNLSLSVEANYPNDLIIAFCLALPASEGFAAGNESTLILSHSYEGDSPPELLIEYRETMLTGTYVATCQPGTSTLVDVVLALAFQTSSSEDNNMALGNPTSTYIHQGPGWLYLNVGAPATGERALIGADGTPTQPAWASATGVTVGLQVVDSNGNIQEVTAAGTTASDAPTWTTVVGDSVTETDGPTWTCVALAPAYIFAGAVSGATEVEIGAKIEETRADQETLGIDAVMTGETDSLSVTMKESDCAKLQLIVPHGTYASGTDDNLPSGSQTYAEIAFGGLPATGIPKIGVLLVSKRKDQAAKFVVSTLYKAYQATATKLAYTMEKETMYKVDFKALADVNRPVGDRAGKVYWQT